MTPEVDKAQLVRLVKNLGKTNSGRCQTSSQALQINQLQQHVNTLFTQPSSCSKSSNVTPTLMSTLCPQNAMTSQESPERLVHKSPSKRQKLDDTTTPMANEKLIDH